jgi:hypothetical protein
MPVFAALAGGKVALYRPLQAPAGGKVLNRPLQLLQRLVKYFTARWRKFQSKSQAAKLGKMKKNLQTDKITHFLARKKLNQL